LPGRQDAVTKEELVAAPGRCIAVRQRDPV
jgi:hypothetical protein